MDGATSFGRPPPLRLWPPSDWQRRWTVRGVLAEEMHWRAQEHGGRKHWPGWQTPESQLVVDEPTTANQVAGLYRALRKAREDVKDEPGAADFYYGEMEMRRNDLTRPRAERWILHAYWALAGYGLRASRAFAAFAVLLIVGAVGLWTVGLGLPASPVPDQAVQPPGFVDVALHAVANATPIGADDLPLTTRGEALRLFLRFTGPVLLGFALLALRGRVKR